MLDHCEDCGAELLETKSERQCIYCGHRTLSMGEKLGNRLVHFVIVNLVLWAAIRFNGTPMGVQLGTIATPVTAFALFGGVLLTRIFHDVGEYLAMAMSLILGVGLYHWTIR
jgi:DNA-directed RNA polymerase subunit RPC12/RpoP